MTAPATRLDDKAKPTHAETLSMGQRVDELISMVATLVVIAFFVQHQRAGTGFFTGAFGPWGQACLYGPLLASLVAPIMPHRL